jgi:predicted NBD/HSP70 family sugar kinase
MTAPDTLPTTASGPLVAGLDVGGTAINATVVDASRRFLIDGLSETPSRVLEGPGATIEALAGALDGAIARAGVAREDVVAVGLDSPGPATADGVISVRGGTNFPDAPWPGFDLRSALEARIGLPVTYMNDANAAALYAHDRHFGADAGRRSSVSAIVGTGLGGGIVVDGAVVTGAAGMGGELGHVHLQMDGLLEPDQPRPVCNCGFEADVESIASLKGIERNLLPYWLGRFPDHELQGVEPRRAAFAVRGLAERGDPMSLAILRQQAIAIGRLFTLAANFIDAHAYFVGGGIVETTTALRDWYLGVVAEHTVLRHEQREVATIAVVPDLDMAGARGAALAALAALASLGVPNG